MQMLLLLKHVMQLETVKLGILGVNSQFVNAYTEQKKALQNTAVKAGASTFSNIEEDMNAMEGAASKATENVIKISTGFPTCKYRT